MTIRGWRRALLLAVITAAIVAGGVLLAMRPWNGKEGSQEAAASVSVFGMCNVFISDIPDDVQVSALPIPDHLVDEVGTEMVVTAHIPSPDGRWMVDDPETGEFVYADSFVSIDAQTGEVTGQRYGSPAEEKLLKGMLASLSVGPWEPADAAWPRTDSPPQSELVEVPGMPLRPTSPRTDSPADSDAAELPRMSDGSGLKYRRPDPGSGMGARPTVGSTPDLQPSQWLVAYTCDSLMALDAETGEVVRKEVIPGEEAMFQRFLDEVVTP